jgi:hypothetical protein
LLGVVGAVCTLIVVAQFGPGIVERKSHMASTERAIQIDFVSLCVSGPA